MTKQATLGPIDPSINGPLNPMIPGINDPNAKVPVSVEFVNAYIEMAKRDFGITDQRNMTDILLHLSEKIHPLTLGQVYKSKSQIQMLARKLMKWQDLGEEKENAIIKFLCSESGSHDYSIRRKEAYESLGLNIEKPNQNLYNIIKNIYDDISNELELENPYNPLNLLMMGRTDSVIPFLAFLEKPITGWGYYTPDPDLKYHYLMSKLTDDVKNVSDRLLYIKDIPIPGHSVIGYYACSYGIIMLLLLCAILYRFSKIFIYSLFTKDNFLFYRAYLYISIIWNLFFSPPAHFKTLPCSIGILVALSLISISKRKESINDRNIK